MNLQDVVRAFAQKPLFALGHEIQGIVSWNIGDRCNLRCRYCTQGMLRDRTGTLENIEEALHSLQVLPGSWLFKLSGGEPFVQPCLFDLCRELIQRGHLIAVQTNFTAPLERFQAFAKLCTLQGQNRLEGLSLSLHRETFEVRDFLKKIEELRPNLDPQTSIHATLVAEPCRFDEIEHDILPQFAQSGVPLQLQPQKEQSRLIDYSEAQKEKLRQWIGENAHEIDPVEACMRGRLCAAGFRYVVIKSSGLAFRCYPASRARGPFSSLGDLKTGLHLLKGPQICPYPFCSCSVPRERGMIF